MLHKHLQLIRFCYDCNVSNSCNLATHLRVYADIFPIIFLIYHRFPGHLVEAFRSKLVRPQRQSALQQLEHNWWAQVWSCSFCELWKLAFCKKTSSVLWEVYVNNERSDYSLNVLHRWQSQLQIVQSLAEEAQATWLFYFSIKRLNISGFFINFEKISN